ncbi:hypothetical protein JTE90_020271 [Oedothorax gibbosus]|uniref:Uncharacterized protein n=1 Tax=Oedothorax gibbosus TaxID=931172 RepID=A0AAV6VM66_9ARAC|nr:hypothetical protein JTE90_020271 [Oedothorax gibbosus]
MSSERDDSGEPLDEGPMKSDAEKSDSTSPKKSNGPTEQAKHRRRRGKGKKRKQREANLNSQPSGSGASQLRSEVSGSGEIADMGSDACSGTALGESRVKSKSDLSRSKSHLDIEPSYDTDSPWDSNEELEANEVLTFSGQIIRPNAPHAPKNSTQFIIDDHNECHLYMSFETPNPYLCENANDGTEHIISEPIGEDPAYIDIDYQYQSPQDFDNTAYYDREFELSYKSNRFEELLRLSREELISGLQALESRLKELSDDLVKENPSPILEKLQHDLLELQEKHCELKDANTKLTALVMQNEKTAEVWAKESAEQHTSDIKDETEQDAETCNHKVSDGGIETELRDNCCVTNNRPDCDLPREDSVEMDDMYSENNGLDPLPRKVDSEEMRTAATV